MVSTSEKMPCSAEAGMKNVITWGYVVIVHGIDSHKCHSLNCAETTKQDRNMQCSTLWFPMISVEELTNLVFCVSPVSVVVSETKTKKEI